MEATRGYRTATGEVYALSGEHSGLALFYGVIRFSDSTTPDNLTAIRVVSRAYVRPDEPSTIGVVVIGANGNRYTRFGRGRDLARPWINAIGLTSAWENLDRPRILDPDEVAVLSAGGKVEW